MERQSDSEPNAGAPDVVTEAEAEAYSEAVAARFRLLSLVAVLRSGNDVPEVDRNYLADLLERVAFRGENANDVLIHPDARARQRSATELQAAFIALDVESARKTEPFAASAEAEVQAHIGAGSVETPRAARRKYGSGIKEIAKANTPEGQAELEAVARALTENVKRKS